MLKERAFIKIIEDLSFDFNEFWARPIIHQPLVFPLNTKLPAGIHFCITGLCLAEHWHDSTKLTSEMIQVLTFSHPFMLEEKHITEFKALRVRAMTCTKPQYIYFWSCRHFESQTERDWEWERGRGKNSPMAWNTWRNTILTVGSESQCLVMVEKS